MAKQTEISWCDSTFNGWEGCTKVSPGCAHCYAESRNHRFGLDNWGKCKPRRRTKTWREPIKWNREAPHWVQCVGCGYRHYLKPGNEESFCPECEHPEGFSVRPRVFCSSLSDWLDDEVPIGWLADLLRLIHDTPNLDWLLLTKRPQNWRSRIEEAAAIWSDAPEHAEEMATFLESWTDCIDMPERGDIPHNVWIGTSVEDQQRANERIPELLKIPAWVRFLSCEPLLGPVLLPTNVDWVICGGESGHGARVFDVDWARSLRDQCQMGGVAFFLKQLGSNFMGREMDKWVTRIKDKKGGDMNEWPQELRIREFPTTNKTVRTE